MNEGQVVESSEGEGGWFVSSFTNGGGSCVEVKFAHRGTILVRDSKDQRHNRPAIDMSAPAWVALLDSLTK